MSQASDRIAARQAATREEILDHAEAIVADLGAGALTVSAVARRMGVRPPSLYKHVDSLHAIYDGLFTRGQRRLRAHVEQATNGAAPGLESVLVGARAFVEWCVLEPALATLLFWRPVPGYEPSPEHFADAVEFLALSREQLHHAVAAGELAPGADTDEGQRLLTVVVSGIFSQQAANEPGVSFATGRFTSLTDEALSMFVRHFQPTQEP